MHSNNILTEYTVVAINSENPIALNDLAHACGADQDWVVRLVEVGIIETQSAAADREAWKFFSSDLQCALEARRLERDFDVSLDAAALILDLQHEVRRLKAALQVQRR